MFPRTNSGRMLTKVALLREHREERKYLGVNFADVTVAVARPSAPGR